MNIDLHLHTVFSYQGETAPQHSDSVIKVEELPEFALRAGLDGVVITDHLTVKAGNDVVSRVQARYPRFLLLRGMEYHSDHGHLLLLGIKDDEVCRRFGKYGPAQPVIDFVNELGGVVIPSHPFKQGYTYSLAERVYSLKGLTALETVNGHCGERINRQAQQAAQKLSLPATGGSDSHSLETVGRVYTEFSQPISSLEDLVRELRLGNCQPRINPQWTSMGRLAKSL